MLALRTISRHGPSEDTVEPTAQPRSGVITPPSIDQPEDAIRVDDAEGWVGRCSEHAGCAALGIESDLDTRGQEARREELRDRGWRLVHVNDHDADAVGGTGCESRVSRQRLPTAWTPSCEEFNHGDLAPQIQTCRPPIESRYTQSGWCNISLCQRRHRQ